MSEFPRSLKAFYSKNEDIIEEFYDPCLRSSNSYLRISGYFSSMVFDLASDAFVEFFKNDGRMKIVCSPFLRRIDAEALIKSDSKVEKDTNLILELLKNKETRTSAEILCYLIDAKFIQLKIATIDNSDEIMHEKIGIFKNNEMTVSFIGSINETGRGWGNHKNRESFNVFLSTHPRDADRVKDHEKQFLQYWEDSVQGMTVAIPSAELFKIASQNSEVGKKQFLKKVKSIRNPNSRIHKPLPYQRMVLEDWKNKERQGLVKFCTGAGKTVVGLLALEWAAKNESTTVIIVPSKTLLFQWAAEVAKGFEKSRVLLVGGGNSDWKKKGVLETYLKSKDGVPSVIIALIDTAASNDFVTRASKTKNGLLLVDEVHNAGANEFRKVLEIDYVYRLGLSATPERYGDEEGTQIIYDYFKHRLEPEIDIPNAIKLGRLVPYVYDFRFAYLSDDEQEEWKNLSLKISQAYARTFVKNKKNEDIFSTNSLKQLIIQRSRIAKKAVSKIDIGIKIIEENYRQGEQWLIFLEDGNEVITFSQALLKIGIKSMVYDGSKNMNERNLIVSHLTSAGGVLLSMRCLDEGVDIPSISHAIIMSSSQNPRQFIQRRGRVLRTAGPQKKRAYIWDVISMPQVEEIENTKALVFSEVARALEFANYADNSSVKVRLTAELSKLNVSLEECMNRELEIIA